MRARGHVPDRGRRGILSWLVAAVISVSAPPHQPVRLLAATSQARSLRHAIVYHRAKTWRYQDRSGVTRTPTVYAERRSTSVPFLTWLNHLWQQRLARARKLAARTVEPQWWLRQAACIRSHEGAWTSNTGNGYYGAYQFLLSTWRSVGGRGYPHLASPAEQTYRAWLVWKRDGGSWREWGTAGICGLR